MPDFLQSFNVSKPMVGKSILRSWFFFGNLINIPWGFLCLFIACPEPPSAASQNEGTHSNSKNSSNQNTGKQTTESLNSQTKPIPGTKLGIKESDEVINSISYLKDIE